MTKKQKQRAVKIFEDSTFPLLYINKKGDFFTSKNLAINSVDNVDDIDIINREDVIPKEIVKTPTSEKLIVEASSGEKIVFLDLKIGDEITPGARAKIGKKNADGIFKTSPQASLKFEKGVFVETIEIKE